MRKTDIKLANLSCPHIKGNHNFVKNTLKYYIPAYPNRCLSMEYLFGLTNGTL